MLMTMLMTTALPMRMYDEVLRCMMMLLMYYVDDDNDNHDVDGDYHYDAYDDV